MNTSKKLSTILLFLFGFLQLTTAQNIEPTLIPFQGRLTDQSGTIIADGSQTLIFNLYDVPVGGTAIWTERHENVGVIDGMVNVFLGAIEEIPERISDGDTDANNDPLFFLETKYLGITVDDPTTTSDVEMIPRQVILPAFHARSSDSLNGFDWSSILDSGNNPAEGKILGSKIQEGGITSTQIGDGSIRAVDMEDSSVSGGIGGTITDGTIVQQDLAASLSGAIVPIGAILPYAGPESSVPAGWLLCDGRLIDDSTAYPELYAVIGTTWGGVNDANYYLPDLRGRVPAGKTDTNTAERLDATIDDGDGDPANDVLVVDGQILGAVGGEDAHQLTEAELARHNHAATDGTAGPSDYSAILINHNGNPHGGSGDVYNFGGSEQEPDTSWYGVLQYVGQDQPHNNIQPVAIVNYIIRAK